MHKTHSDSFTIHSKCHAIQTSMCGKECKLWQTNTRTHKHTHTINKLLFIVLIIIILIIINNNIIIIIIIIITIIAVEQHMNKHIIQFLKGFFTFIVMEQWRFTDRKVWRAEIGEGC